MEKTTHIFPLDFNDRRLPIDGHSPSPHLDVNRETVAISFGHKKIALAGRAIVP
jgi:hypothetical protein